MNEHNILLVLSLSLINKTVRVVDKGLYRVTDTEIRNGRVYCDGISENAHPKTLHFASDTIFSVTDLVICQDKVMPQ